MDLTLARRPFSAALLAFADAVGDIDAGPVACVGGRTQWEVGGPLDASAREIAAPAGIVEYVPEEMVVRCGAGTTVGELDETLARHGQRVALGGAPNATAGGRLAVGHSGVRRLGDGPIRDTLLEVHLVSAHGRIIKAGGPVVKNVSGFDLCRLFVGSLGTVGLAGEVVLRCRPLPRTSRWYRGRVADPDALRAKLYRPTSLLWNGESTWVLLEGHPDDVDAEEHAALPSFTEVGGPPDLPAGGRISVRPSAVRNLRAGDHGGFVAEIGVGIVHTAAAVAPAPLPEDVQALHRRMRSEFDPTERLNPGRRP